AFLYGWTLFFVISSGSMATLAVAFSSYLRQIIPLSPALAKLAAISMIVAVTVVNVIGTRESANLQDWTTAIKVGAILVMSAILFVLGHGFAATSTVSPTNTGARSIFFGVGFAECKLVVAAILISIFSATNGLTLTAPRVYYAMARDGVFFHQLAKIHPRFRTPAFAVLAGSAWAIVLAATGTFEQLLTYVVCTGWLLYALGAASIFIYRRRTLDRELPYRVP